MHVKRFIDFTGADIAAAPNDERLSEESLASALGAMDCQIAAGLGPKVVGMFMPCSVRRGMFFTAKTHKEGSPIRVIVSEVGNWQPCLVAYLQEGLCLLDVNDPFIVRRPSEVSQFLEESRPQGVRAFSLDIKDLYCSLPQAALADTVQEGT